MNILWGLLISLIGLFMFICALLKSEFILYRIFTMRSKMLWGENVHKFYIVVGAIITVFGILVALGVFL